MGLQVDIEKIAKRPRNPFRRKFHLWFRDIWNDFNFGWFLTIFYYHDILPFLRKISRDSGFYKAKKYRLLIILWRPKSPHIWRIPNDKQYIVLSWDICHLWGFFRQNKKYFYFIFHLQIAYCMRPLREFSKKKEFTHEIWKVWKYTQQDWKKVNLVQDSEPIRFHFYRISYKFSVISNRFQRLW